VKRAAPVSALLEAGPAHEAPADDDHTIDDLDGQPREPARRGAANDTAAIPRIELGFVAWASESSRFGLPQRHVTAGVGANTRIGHDAVGRPGARVVVELVRRKPDEEDLVQARAFADDTAAGVDGIDHDGRRARQQITERDDLSNALAAGEDEAISDLRTLRAGITGTGLGGGVARRTKDDAGAESGS
jgi:hypothetical protein